MARTIILSIFVLSVLLVMYTATDFAYGIHAADGPFTVVEDLEKFTINAQLIDESTINVVGYAPRTADEPVEITVTAPNGNIVGVDQLTADSNNHYMGKIKINPELWNVNGAYLITAHQGPG